MTETPEPSQPMDVQHSEAEQRAFFDAALDCARAALAAAGEVERTIELAGVVIRLVFAGPRLEQEFMGALGHLEIEGGAKPAATFYVFDSDSTGVAMVPPPVPQSSFTDRGDIWGFSSQVIRSAFHWSEFSVSLLNVADGVGVYWVDTTKNLPYWAKSSPMRSLFHWLMEAHGRQLVHAAAFGDANGGVLLTGKGGVGKSTTSLAALTAGMTFIGDDYLVVGLDPEPTAYSLYSTAKVEPKQAARFPELMALVRPDQPADDEKLVLYLHPTRADQIARALPLKWVLTPRFNDAEETAFERVSAVELHGAATFTTMSQLPHAGVKTHDFIGRLIEATPRRRVKLGRDIPGVPRAIAALLADPDAAAQPEPVREAREPLISVIIPVYNAAPFLAQAIASILEQNYSALEIIVVDDASTDDIEGAVRALPVDVRLFRQHPNQGPAAARNRGVRDVSGDYIAFLDVDDLWPKDNLAGMLEALTESGADVALGRGQLAQITPDGGHEFMGNPDESFPYYIGAALYRREAFERNGLFDATMYYGEDLDWFNRARENKLAVHSLDRTTLIVRRHEGNMTRGKSMIELHVLRVAKKALDRRRLAKSGQTSA